MTVLLLIVQINAEKASLAIPLKALQKNIYQSLSLLCHVMLTLPVSLWVPRLMVSVFLRKKGRKVLGGFGVRSGGVSSKLWASWDPYGEECENRSFLFLSLASLLGLLLTQLHCLPISSQLSLLCRAVVTHWFPTSVRLVLYWGSQGEAKTGEPTGTAPLSNSWTRLNPAGTTVSTEEPPEPVLQPVTSQGKSHLLGYIVSSWSSLTWERISQQKAQLWQVPCSETATSALLRVSQETCTEVVGICTVIEYFVAAPPVKLTKNVG